MGGGEGGIVGGSDPIFFMAGRVDGWEGGGYGPYWSKRQRRLIALHK